MFLVVYGLTFLNIYTLIRLPRWFLMVRRRVDVCLFTFLTNL